MKRLAGIGKVLLCVVLCLAFALPFPAQTALAEGSGLTGLAPSTFRFAGHSVSAATEIYGRLSGVALTLLHLPGVFASALSTAVMPAVAGTQDKSAALRVYIVRPLQATMICTLPGMALLFIYARPLCTGLFNNAPAASLLRLLTPGGIFFYLQTTLAGVLQGLGEVKRLLVNNALAGCTMLAGIVLLVPLPGMGVYGAALAMDLSWMCGFLLHLAAVRSHLDQGLPWSRIAGAPLLATIAAAAAWFLAAESGTGTALCIGAAAIAYGSILQLSLRLSL